MNIFVTDPANQLPAAAAHDATKFEILGRLTGFKVLLKRNGELENATLYPIQREHLYQFDFEENPSPTAAEIANEFVAQNTNYAPAFEEEPYVDITIDPTDGSGETILLTARNGNLFDVAKLRGSLLTVTEVVKGVAPQLTADTALRNFPVQPQINGGRISGEYGSIGSCGPYCVFHIEQCFDPCDVDDRTLDTMGLTGRSERFNIWVANSDAGAYATWVSALEALVASCVPDCTTNTFAIDTSGAGPHTNIEVVTAGLGAATYALADATLDLDLAADATDIVGDIRAIFEGAPYYINPVELDVTCVIVAGVTATITISGLPAAITSVTIDADNGISQALTQSAC
jgi:hypothetical protein